MKFLFLQNRLTSIIPRNLPKPNSATFAAGSRRNYARSSSLVRIPLTVAALYVRECEEEEKGEMVGRVGVEPTTPAMSRI